VVGGRVERDRKVLTANDWTRKKKKGGVERKKYKVGAERFHAPGRKEGEKVMLPSGGTVPREKDNTKKTWTRVSVPINDV